mmetsp:Transcript_27034/g.77993  ORF Transcript_27034/g.77993 Transcript_27034/m.77993 type:complete len:451 (-) Transcript_27034:234-1586(-)
MASPTHLQYQQQYEQPSLANWSAPSSASSHLNHTTASAGSSGNHGPPPEVLPRLDGVGSTYGSASHLLPSGLMEQGSILESTSSGPSTTTSTNLPNANENGTSHYPPSSNGTPNDASSDLITQLTQFRSQVASLQKMLRQSESQSAYLTKCCTEAGTELAKSHHEHTQTKNKLQELSIQEKKSAIMAENARSSLRNVMAENVELREEVVRLRELLARSGMGTGSAVGGMGMEGVHLRGGGGAASAHENGIVNGNPLYNSHGGSAVDQHQHIQQHNHSVGGISVMNFGSTGAGTSSNYSSNTPPPGTAPASSTASGTASANSSLASPLEAYQLTGSYPGKSGGASSYPGKDYDAMNGLLAPPNQLPPLAYTGSLGMTLGGNGSSPYGMAEYNTTGLPSETAARALEREAADGSAGPGGRGGGRGTRGGRGSGGGRGRGAGRGGGGYRGRRN